jgi:prolyl oligopeptidase
MIEAAIDRRNTDIGDTLDWLKAESAEMKAWQDQQNRLAIARLDQLGDRDEARALFDAAIRATRRFPPRRAGDRWFWLEYRGAEGRSVLMLGDDPGVAGKLLADAGIDGAAARALDFYYPSRDGQHVAIGWSLGGTEQSTIELVHTATGRVLPFKAPRARMSVVSWLADGSGFYYDALADGGARRLFLYRLGADAAIEQVFDYRPGLVRARVSPDGLHVVVFSGYPNLVPVAYNRAGSDSAWTALLPASNGNFSGDLVEDRLITLTTEQAGTGRVVSIPLATAEDRSTWRELVPQSELVLDTVAVVANTIVVGGLRAAAAEIATYDLDGTPASKLALPPRSAISVRPIELAGVDPMFFASPEDLFFLHHNPAQGPASYRYHVPTHTLTLTAQSGRVHEGFGVRQINAPAPDGTTIPLVIIERADRDGPAPVMLHAYAGPFALMPGYNWDLAQFVEDGGVVVIAHCRGGTEFGPEWQAAASGPAGTQVKMDDLYAAADYLVNNGVAVPGRLGFTGASAGGVVAGIAMTQRPDLFAVVCPQYAMFDYAVMIPYLVSKASLSEAEYDRQVAQVMRLSPLHSVGPETEYPATLIQMGGQDPLTPLFSSRQITERLQQCDQRGDHLLRIYDHVGHSSAPTIERLAAFAADWLVFSRGLLIR